MISALTHEVSFSNTYVKKDNALDACWINFFIHINLLGYKLLWNAIFFISTFHYLKNPLISVTHVNLTYCIQPYFLKVAVHCNTDDKNSFSDKKMAAQNKEFPLQRIISWKEGNIPGQKPGNNVSCSFLKPLQEVAQMQP